MNSYEIFRKLTKGIKFDRKNHQHIVKKKDGDISTSLLKSDSKDDLLKAEHINDGVDAEFSIGVDCQIKKQNKKKKSKLDSKQWQLECQIEQVNRLRNKNRIHVWGSDITEPITSFDKLAVEYKVNPLLEKNLVSQGYLEPTPVQMQAWPLMLKGREVLCCAPTGSGKTAAFLLPVLHQLREPQRRGFRAVILSPTCELAKQTYRECVRLSEGLGLRVRIINSAKKAKEKFGQKSAKKFDLLVTTPNRLIYLLMDAEGEVISLANVEWLIVDESDRLFEAGDHGFRDQLASIYTACSGPNVRRAMFSATFTHEVEHWCKLNLNNLAIVSVGIRNTACEDVKQEMVFCGDESGKLLALRDILRKGYEPPVLMFVQTKERAKELFRELIYDNIMVDVIHADRTQLQRDNVVKAFRDRKIWVLICTELMARGIDFKGVNLVINYDFPPTAVSYIHRVGRTGRAQREGRAVTFWTMSDKPYLRSVAQVIRGAGQEVPSWMLELKKESKNVRKDLAKQQPMRGHVSKAVHQEKVNRKRRKEMINRSQTLKKSKVSSDNSM